MATKTLDRKAVETNEEVAADKAAKKNEKVFEAQEVETETIGELAKKVAEGKATVKRVKPKKKDESLGKATTQAKGKVKENIIIPNQKEVTFLYTRIANVMKIEKAGFVKATFPLELEGFGKLVEFNKKVLAKTAKEKGLKELVAGFAAAENIHETMRKIEEFINQLEVKSADAKDKKKNKDMVTLEKLEEEITAGLVKVKAGSYQIGFALMKIRDDCLFLVAGKKTFNEYTQSRWKNAHTMTNFYIHQVETHNLLLTADKKLDDYGLYPANLDPLNDLEPKDVVTAFEKAKAAHKKDDATPLRKQIKEEAGKFPSKTVKARERKEAGYSEERIAKERKKEVVRIIDKVQAELKTVIEQLKTVKSDEISDPSRIILKNYASQISTILS